MRVKTLLLGYFVTTLLALGAEAQTTVTTAGGTTNTVPVYTGSATLGNSPIAVSGSNVGIGTTAPQAGLDIEVNSDPITGGPVMGLKVNNTITVGNTTDYPQNLLLSQYSGSGTQSFLYGQVIDMINAGSGSITNGYASFFRVMNSSSSGSIANGFGVYIDTPQGGGPISNAYGMTINPQKVSGVTTGYGLVQFGSNDINSFAGSVGIGTTSPGAKLEVDGNVKLTANSGASITFADGTVQSTAYTGVVCGGDFAESVNVSGRPKGYEPGDVLVLTSHGEGDVARSSEPYSTLVAGIYSTKPGYVGRRLTTPKSSDEIPMAMVGIVPTKVSTENGPIQRGDLLVTSSLNGYAMKGSDRNRMLGAVLGKAMGSLDSGTGVIEVLVTLQ